MFRGYFLILVAATFWGGSAVFAKHLFADGTVGPLLISQTRVTFAWLLVLGWLAVRNPGALRVRPRDLPAFLLLGVLGVAGSNFFLYFAVGRMDTATADIIQFTAPAMVALWMWWRGFEGFDAAKGASLTMALVGASLALGVGKAGARLDSLGVASAVASAFSYAFLMVWGKHLSRRYPPAAYLHYSMLGAALFWCFVTPPWRLVAAVPGGHLWGTLVLFAVASAVIPYGCFYAGLKRVPASRAGIVGMWEPVMVSVAGWALLGESLTGLQIAGIALVIAAIVVIEIAPAARVNQPGS